MVDRPVSKYNLQKESFQVRIPLCREGEASANTLSKFLHSLDEIDDETMISYSHSELRLRTIQQDRSQRGMIDAKLISLSDTVNKILEEVLTNTNSINDYSDAIKSFAEAASISTQATTQAYNIIQEEGDKRIKVLSDKRKEDRDQNVIVFGMPNELSIE